MINDISRPMTAKEVELAILEKENKRLIKQRQIALRALIRLQGEDESYVRNIYEVVQIAQNAIQEIQILELGRKSLLTK